MPIVNSTIIEDRAQVDGRRFVRERHTDNLGAIQEVSYLAEAGADVNAAMTARVATLDAQAKAKEISDNLQQSMGDAL